MKRALSGITPSGKLHIGNYIGAIQQFIKMQEEYEMYIFVSNLHSLTIFQEKEDREINTRDLVAFYLASGLDVNKTAIFLQSDVLAHAQLAWIIQCYTYMGELSRMTQYKDKSLKHAENINAGLFTYPCLMVADILLYDPIYVPVGEDQRQHIELARNVAIRFNNKYGDTFVVPDIHITKGGAKIMSLTDPTKKMSKSDDAKDKGCIYLLDDRKTIINKIKSATTDSINKVQYDEENQPGIANLLNIYVQFSDLNLEEALEKFKDYGYGDFKKEVAIAVADKLETLQEKYRYVLENNLVEKALQIGYEKASVRANKKVQEVQNKLGINLKL